MINFNFFEDHNIFPEIISGKLWRRGVGERSSIIVLDFGITKMLNYNLKDLVEGKERYFLSTNPSRPKSDTVEPDIACLKTRLSEQTRR